MCFLCCPSSSEEPLIDLWLCLPSAHPHLAVVTIVQLLVLAVIVIAGLTKADRANMTPFFPNGFAGVVNGAAFVFFSFIGFDCVSTLAEAVSPPAAGGWWRGLVGVGTSTVWYSKGN